MTADQSVNELALSTRASMVLYNNRVETIAELTQHTPRDLMRYRNCGKRTIQEIQTKLERNGFTLLQAPNQPEIDALKNKIDRLQKELVAATHRNDYLRDALDEATAKINALWREADLKM